MAAVYLQENISRTEQEAERLICNDQPKYVVPGRDKREEEAAARCDSLSAPGEHILPRSIVGHNRKGHAVLRFFHPSLRYQLPAPEGATGRSAGGTTYQNVFVQKIGAR